MPARNTIKEYGEDYYYHVYNRGANKQTIFHDDADYKYFLHLLKRHLSTNPTLDKLGREYRHLRTHVDLISYCLMPNHFHLLLYNRQREGMELLMRSITTAYSMYYNRKYDHSGRLFQGAYKASLIESEPYLQHISRYIHRNPKDYEQYPYSSFTPLVNQHSIEWLSNDLLDNIFEGSTEDYKIFVADYEDYEDTLEEIKIDLADS